MKLVIEIQQDNDAFKFGNNGSETARILRELADRYDGYNIEGCSDSIQDYNGNTVGKSKWTWGA